MQLPPKQQTYFMKPEVHYTVDAANKHAHLFQISLHIEKPQAGSLMPHNCLYMVYMGVIWYGVGAEGDQ